MSCTSELCLALLSLQEWETTQNGCKVRCAQWMRIVFSSIRLELKTSVYEMNVTVMSTVPGCDVTTVQQHYKGSTSSPPRVARLCQIREASLVALRKFPKTSTLAHMCRSFDLSNPPYQYPVTRIVTRRHCTICQVHSSCSALYPRQALISICGISHVPALLFRCHSDSHRS